MAIMRFAKDPDERLTLEINFLRRLRNRTVSSATSTIQQLSGPVQSAGTVNAMLDGSPVASPASSWVTQRVVDGVLGCSFLVKLKVTLSDGDVLVSSTQIDVQLGA